MSETNFLNTDIGELGKKKLWEVPPELVREYAPTISNVTSLEDVEKRKQLVRSMFKETSRIYSAVNYDVAGGGTLTMFTCPANKKMFIDSITISGFNRDAVTAGILGLEIYNSAGVGRASLGRISFPIIVAGAQTLPSVLNLAFTIPQILYAGETLRLGANSGYDGQCTATATGWSEDA